MISRNFLVKDQASLWFFKMNPLLPISFVLQNKFLSTVIVIAISIYFLLRRDPRVKYHLNKLGGPPTFPVLGNSLQFLIPHSEVIPLFERFFKEHGHTYRIWMGNLIPYAFTCDVKLIEVRKRRNRSS